MSSSRYYESGEGEIKAGKISRELREALNLPENEVPIWIYRMRALGYPPGWLKKAVVDTNDIFDTDPKEDENKSGKRKSPEPDQVQYDHSKLIEYPGFNTPMPKGCNDYHYYLNMPAMLEHQQLDYAKKHMNSFTAAPLPKRIKNNTNVKGSVEQDVPNKLEVDNHSQDIESPDSESSDAKDPAQETKLTKSKSLVSLPEEIKLVSKGSPMPKPVQRAPLERFSEGVVGELLYFENLPQSTGKFDSIRGLLNNIRKSASDKSFEEPKDEQ